MARKSGLLTKLKVFYMWMSQRDTKHIRCMSCGRCDSINIVKITPHSEEVSNSDDLTRYVWRESVKCLDCGAVCAETQRWEWSD